MKIYNQKIQINLYEKILSQLDINVFILGKNNNKYIGKRVGGGGLIL